MEHLLKVVELIFSWPGVAIFSVFILRKPLSKITERLVNSSDSKAKIGPIELELGKLAADGSKALDILNEISALVAKGKLIELEFAHRTVGPTFDEEQQKQLTEVINLLRLKLEQLEASNV